MVYISSCFCICPGCIYSRNKTVLELENLNKEMKAMEGEHIDKETREWVERFISNTILTGNCHQLEWDSKARTEKLLKYLESKWERK